MPIKREGDYLITRDFGITTGLGIETDKITSCIEEVIKRHYLGVFGSPSFGFNQDNLNFLHEIPFIKQVWFWDVALKNIEGLYALKGVTYMGVNPKRPKIDYKEFPNLEILVSDWNKNDLNLSASNIKKFYLWHCNPKNKSLEGIELPKNLTELEFNWLNAESLAGLQTMDSLSELGIHRSRNICDISLLPVVAPNLKKIIIDSCGKLKNLDGILNHPSLEVAWVGNKKILS